MYARHGGLTLVEVIFILGIIGLLAIVLFPALQLARESSRLRQCQHHLQQLGMALQVHESSHGTFPPGVVAEGDNFRNGTHSGFVFLLPFLDQQTLFDAYDQSQPWDAAENLAIGQAPIPLLLCPSNSSSVPQQGGLSGAPTDYAFCKGPYAYLCAIPAGGGMFDINSRICSDDLTRGASHTMAVGEAASNALLAATSAADRSGLKMGQIWSKANFDGIDEARHLGGRGSVLAVTAQNPGPDGVYGTQDDVLAPLNASPVAVSIDAQPGPDCSDHSDRVRGFYAYHRGGANFAHADASVRFVSQDISQQVYRTLSQLQ